MRAIILSIGDELTLGQTQDTNSPWLSARLAERAILTIEHRTVADDRAAIAGAIASSSQRCDVLIVTGGLGPTADDLTREALGDAVTPGRPLVEDPGAREHLREWFGGRGRGMPAMNARQALRPGSFRCLANPRGTAPGLAGTCGQCLVFCLPGPPREMQGMFSEQVVPSLPAPAPGEVLLTSGVHEYGLGESVAAGRLGDLMRRDGNPLVGTTASESIVTARIRVAGSQAWAHKRLGETVETIQRLWHPHAFAVNGGTLSEALGQLLQEKRLTLATAESCTGGWLGRSIVDRAGASAYYLGGWITYSNDMKVACLGVPREVIDRHGAVSAEVAQAMAAGAVQRSGAQCALAITGIAGPPGPPRPSQPGAAPPEKPTGTVFIAAVSRGAEGGAFTQVRRFEFAGDRSMVRDRSVKSALQMLRFMLIGAPDAPLLWETSARPQSPSPETALLALGSNLGDRRAILQSAVDALRNTPGVEVLAVSGLIETEAVGVDGPAGSQPPYLNGAVRVRTTLSPRRLLEACLAIEQAHGRERGSGQRWEPRTLDIDLLLYGQYVIDEPGLHVPHPRLHQRLFALEPAAEIAGDMPHPVEGLPLKALLARLRQPA